MLIEARVVRSKKDAKGESNARTVSGMLPFIEYELHRQLLYKLRLYAFNAAFSLQYHIVVGDDLVVASVVATGVVVAAIPLPPTPLTVTIPVGGIGNDSSSNIAVEIERRSSYYYSTMVENVRQWRSSWPGTTTFPLASSFATTTTATTTTTVVVGNSEAFVVNVDDDTDVDLLAALLDVPPPPEVIMVNTHTIPGSVIAENGFNISLVRRISWSDLNCHYHQRRSDTICQFNQSFAFFQIANVVKFTHCFKQCEVHLQLP